MEALISEQEEYIRELRETMGSFDARAYMENGDFAKQMLMYCEDQGVDVKGDYPVYEMFPYKIKIDSENQEIIINRRKMQCVSPEYLVLDIKQKREKLMKASFNASGFLSELAGAYDTLSAIRRKEKQDSNRSLELLLKDIYRYMAPMQRFRRTYDMQSFAFDLARLYSSDLEFTADSRQYRFGKARYESQMIRVLDRNGNEDFIGTIIFFPKETIDETATE